MVQAYSCPSQGSAHGTSEMPLWLRRAKDSTRNMAQGAQREPRKIEDELGEQDGIQVIPKCDLRF